IVSKAAVKLGVEIDPEVPEIISEYTIDGRKANSMLADAYGVARYRKAFFQPGGPLKITKEHIYEVIQSARLSPYVTSKAEPKAEIGRVFGLGVSGFIG